MTRTEYLTVMVIGVADDPASVAPRSGLAHAALQRRHDRLLLPVIAQFGGRLVTRRGLGRVVSFRAPTEAVRCGIALQNRLAAERAAAPEGLPNDLRIALHAGEVEVQRHELVGEVLRLATELADRTPPNELWFTEAVRLAMNRAEIPHAPLPPQGLKGPLETRSLYRVSPSRGGVEADGPVPATARTPQRFAKAVGLDRPRRSRWMRGRALRAAGGGLLLLLALLALRAWWSPGDDSVRGRYGDTFGPVSADTLPAATASSDAEDRLGAAQTWLQRGHEAYIAGDRRKAARAYGEALSRDRRLADDPVLATRLVSCLSWAHELAIPLIEAYPSGAIDAALIERATAVGRYGRGRAVRLLEAAGKTAALDWTVIALMDLEEADTCDQQIAAIASLAQRGDARAEPALQTLAGPGGVRGWFAEKHCARDAARDALEAIAGRGVLPPGATP